MDYLLPSKTNYTVYTKKNCPYCSKVKDLLQNENVWVIECDGYLTNRDHFLNFIFQLTQKNYKTFPMVFHEGQFIGGYTETLQYYTKKQQEANVCFDF